MSSKSSSVPKLTKNQSLVLQALARAQVPMTAYTILDDLRPEGFRAPLQVYRALEKLTASGQVHRLESINAFVACSHHNCGENHTVAFTICNRCEKATEISDADLSQSINAVAQNSQFQLSTAVVELRGLCQSCQN